MLAPTFEYNCEYHYVAEAQHIVHAVHTPRSGLSLVVFRCGISNKSTTDLLISFHSLSLSLPLSLSTDCCNDWLPFPPPRSLSPPPCPSRPSRPPPPPSRPPPASPPLIFYCTSFSHCVALGSCQPSCQPAIPSSEYFYHLNIFT